MVSPAVASGNGPPQRNGFHETRMSYSGGSRVPFPPLSLLPDLFYCIQNNLPYFGYLLSILFCDAQFPKSHRKIPLIFPFLHRSLKHLLFLHLRICSLLYQTIFSETILFTFIFGCLYQQSPKITSKMDISITTSKCYNKKEGKINVKKGTTMTKTVQKSKARDMTQGSIWKQLLLFFFR